MPQNAPDVADPSHGCVLRKKTPHKSGYGTYSPLYMEKVKKWKHHFRHVIDKLFRNARPVRVPISFAPMEKYFNGFTCEYYPFDPREHSISVDGMYEIVNGDTIRIYFATDVPVGRQRFSIAHEFSHVVQKYDGEFMADMDAIPDPEERQKIIERVAEITASYYLAPYPFVHRAYSRAIARQERDIIGALATEFNVSYEMMKICLSDYSLQKQ